MEPCASPPCLHARLPRAITKRRWLHHSRQRFSRESDRKSNGYPHDPVDLVRHRPCSSRRFCRALIAVFPQMWEDALLTWSSGAAGAQVPYKHKVGGSNPSSTTTETKSPSNGAFSLPLTYPGFEPRESSTALWAVEARAPRQRQREGRIREANSQIPPRPPPKPKPQQWGFPLPRSSSELGAVQTFSGFMARNGVNVRASALVWHENAYMYAISRQPPVH